MTISRATLDDIEVITAHRRAIFLETGHRDERLLDDMVASFRPWLRSRLSSEEYIGWFVTEDGSIVSGLGLWLIDWPPHVIGPDSRLGDILNVYTRPESRRKGMARALMNVALDWCRANAIRRVRLNAATGEAKSLYQSLGFQPTNEMRLVIA